MHNWNSRSKELLLQVTSFAHCLSDERKTIVDKNDLNSCFHCLIYELYLWCLWPLKTYKIFQLTWADIVVANMLATLANMLPLSLEEDFPTLEHFKNKIFELPNIKKWIETRPVTENWNVSECSHEIQFWKKIPLTTSILVCRINVVARLFNLKQLSDQHSYHRVVFYLVLCSYIGSPL